MRLEGRKALGHGRRQRHRRRDRRRLAAEGAEVWVGDIDDEGAAAVAARGRRAMRLQLDVTDFDSARAAIESIGGLDVLVNNAGTDEFGFFNQTTPDVGSACSRST